MRLLSRCPAYGAPLSKILARLSVSRPADWQSGGLASGVLRLASGGLAVRRPASGVPGNKSFHFLKFFLRFRGCGFQAPAGSLGDPMEPEDGRGNPKPSFSLAFSRFP